MSAPDTNLNKQKRRHVGPMLGISAGLAVVVVMFLGYLAYSVDTETPSPTPETEAVVPGPETPAPTEPLVTPPAD